MKKLCLVFLVLFTLIFSGSVNAATFDLSFDNSYGDDNWNADFLTGDIVGGVSFSFDISGGPQYSDSQGDYYNWSQLSNINFDIQFTGAHGYPSVSFTFGDLEAGAPFVFISNDGLFARFTDNTALPSGGVLDFIDSTDRWLFSFGEFGNTLGNNPNGYILMDLTNPLNSKSGDYLMTSAVPVPAAVWLLGSGAAGLVLLRRRFDQK